MLYEVITLIGEALRLGLTGEWRIVDEQVGRFDQAGIGRNPVAFSEQEEIARDQFLRQDGHQGVFAADLDLGGEIMAQSRHGPLGPVFLNETEQGIEKSNAGQRPAQNDVITSYSIHYTKLYENYKAVDAGLNNLSEVKVPAKATSKLKMAAAVSSKAPKFVKEVTGPIVAGLGDNLPVSKT